MYGDCQVLSSMGGNGVAPEALFPSTVQNPNFNFMANMPFHTFPSIMPKEEMGVVRGKEEMETASGSEHMEGVSGNEQETSDQLQLSKKKRYHRHTARQIQEMEALFKECPHPDDKQRLRLSQELGLKPRQVKFWFQNRRTQMKAQQDRQENVILRAENENLKNENYRLQAALRSIICPNCGGAAMLGELAFDEHQLRLENARLKEEFERVCCLASRYSGRQIQGMSPTPLLTPSLDLDMSIYPRHFHDPMPSSNCPEMMAVPPPPALMPETSHFVGAGGSGGLVIMEEEKPLAMELAVSSMDELVKMCQVAEPLWIRAGESGREVLNVEEHARMFQWPLNVKQSAGYELRMEATRATAVVIMNSITLVDAFLDANKWMELFPSIISRAKTLQMITPGISGHASGSLHLMYAELQALSPLIPTREAHFLRYCQQNAEEGTWAIVDFPLESFQENFQSSFPRYKRRPSGCVIQDMPNGYSRVTWVEHAEVEDAPVHQIFDQFVSNGTAFGAQRWLAVLQRQCERLASLMARNISDLGVIPSPESRKNLMHLAQRMIRSFCVSLSTSYGQSWTALSDSGDDTIRITTRKATEPGQPNGLILTAVSTTWLPYPHYQVFELLRDECRRAQLDVLSNGNSLHEVAHIANGSNPGNCISLLRINVASNSSQNVELMLQESCTDDSGSLVVYSTVNVDAIQLAMTTDDTSCIPLLPLGFVIVPADQATSPGSDAKPTATVGGGSCFLTVGLQVLASTVPTAKLNLSSVTAINNHLCSTVHQISAALMGSGICANDVGTLGSSAEQAPPSKTD
ncbi:hypothetical protein NMG60_11027585 [Bertholletia excelsa]